MPDEGNLPTLADRGTIGLKHVTSLDEYPAWDGIIPNRLDQSLQRQDGHEDADSLSLRR